jgi:4'-phosphopantetheinyl transferase
MMRPVETPPWSVTEGSGLGPGDVHVWLAEIPDTDFRSKAGQNHRITRTKSIARRARERAIGRALVRQTLSRYCPIRFDEWRFTLNNHGRPEIAPGITQVPLRFNLAHAGGLYACAVTLDCDIGVDVESVDAADDVERLASRFFASAEAEDIASAPALLKRELFLSYWTLKEAFVKALGGGLSIRLDKVRFRFDPTTVRADFDADLAEQPHDWQFACFRPTTCHHLAIAVRSGQGVSMHVHSAWVSLDRLCMVDLGEFEQSDGAEVAE